MLEIAREKFQDKNLELIYIKGSLDAQTAPDFERFFHGFSNRGPSFFIIEASRLQQVANDGITSLFRLAQNIQATGGFFVIVHPNIELSMLFTFLGLTDKVPICNKIEEALHYFRENDIEENYIQHNYHTPNIPEVEAEPAYIRNSDEAEDFTPSFSPTQQSKSFFKKKTEVNCSHCGLSLNVSHSGAFMCPGCGHQFNT